MALFNFIKLPLKKTKSIEIPSYGTKNDFVKKYWNKRARSLANFFTAYSTQIYRQREIDLISRYLNPGAGRKLLKLDLWNEVNNTRILFWAAKKGYRVYGLDIADYLVGETKKAFKKKRLKGKFICCDMRNIAFPSNSFDYLYSMGTIEHVPDYDRAIREIYRVLKPGGRAIVGVPNKLDIFLRPLIVWFLDYFGLYPYAPEKSFTKKGLRKVLEKEGFSIIEEKSLLFMPGWLRILDLFLFWVCQPAGFLTRLPLNFFNFLEKNFDWCQRNGYLLAFVIKKKP